MNVCFVKNAVQGFTDTKVGIFTYRKNSLFSDLHSLNTRYYRILY